MKGEAPDEPLRALCDHDFLVGGMSIAIDVKIDEALGPLLEAIGGGAPRIKVLDIQGTPPVFTVVVGGQQHQWEIGGLEALADTLNQGFAADAGAKALVLLGEWEDMLQVWAVPKAALAELWRYDWFKPSNPKSLKRLL